MCPDIIALVERARFHGLFVEMHTNAKLLEQIDYRHLLPLRATALDFRSDGEIPAVHDMMRAEPGNFESNLRALELASALNIPTTVRTFASRRNLGKIVGLAAILDRYACVEKWSIREFAPLGGATSRRAHELPKEDFQAEVNSIAAFYSAHRRAYKLAVVSEEDMADCYCLITEDGVFYGHAAGASDYRRIGAFPQDKMQDILSRLCYDRTERDRTYCAAQPDTKGLQASLT